MGTPDYMKYDGRTPEPPYDTEAAPSSCTVDSIVGRVVEIGDIDALDGNPGMVIECTREQLKAHGRNLAFENVNVQLAPIANRELTDTAESGEAMNDTTTDHDQEWRQDLAAACL